MSVHSMALSSFTIIAWHFEGIRTLSHPSNSISTQGHDILSANRLRSTGAHHLTEKQVIYALKSFLFNFYCSRGSFSQKNWPSLSKQNTTEEEEAQNELYEITNCGIGKTLS